MCETCHDQLRAFGLGQEHLFSLVLTDTSDAGTGPKFISPGASRMGSHVLASQLQPSPPPISVSVRLSVFPPSPLHSATWLGLKREPWGPLCMAWKLLGQRVGVATDPTAITALDFQRFRKQSQDSGRWWNWQRAWGVGPPLSSTSLCRGPISHWVMLGGVRTMLTLTFEPR